MQAKQNTTAQHDGQQITICWLRLEACPDITIGPQPRIPYPVTTKYPLLVLNQDFDAIERYIQRNKDIYCTH
jgi:hypothetical protein